MRSNCLLIHSRGVDKILSMQEHIQWGRAFLQRFHEETPWQLPFSVNGTTRRHGNLKVEKDFSNFEEMLKLALSDYRKDGFRNVGNPNVNDLLPDSYSSTGFRLSCSDGYGIKKSRDRCSLSMGSPAYSEGIGALREFAFSCYDFKPGEINAP
ncbi:hypothetical protein CGLAMM_11035 [Acetobacteraceae bacterium EV16G]|uniref:Uncharacterized protein n=2 Tax=Sorlinia euscelidii TaxID=3081148 RepID=A0ABU7U417_9PROT